jgi:putative hydrolase of the HAD superfamily
MGLAQDPRTVWLFDLDNTLHDASRSAFRHLNASMTGYIERELGLSPEEAGALRAHYWRRYGATLLGLMRHHGVQRDHFLHQTHLLPGLEQELLADRHDIAALRRLAGRKLILTNAPLHYARRVLGALGIADLFEAVIAIEQLSMFGQLRPKPDRRMFQALAVRLGVAASRCVLVEDTLAHQKSAYAVGMTTVWMQRWARRAGAGSPGAESGPGLHRRPAYVCARINALQQLHRVL